MVAEPIGDHDWRIEKRFGKVNKEGMKPVYWNFRRRRGALDENGKRTIRVYRPGGTYYKKDGQ